MQPNRRVTQGRRVRSFRQIHQLAGIVAPIVDSLERRQLFAFIDPGSIAIVRIGDGAAALTNAAQMVFIDRYAVDSQGNIAPTPSESIPLPPFVDGANRRLTLSGNATSEGQLNRSSDGKYLLLAGYDAGPGTVGPTGGAIGTSLSTSVARTVGRVDVTTGAVDTTTSLNNAFSGNNVRSVASADGSAMWVAGTAASATNGGVFYTSLGGSTGSQLVQGNIRVVNAYNGQLYLSASSVTSTFSIATVGTGLPTSGAQTITTLPGLPTSAGPSMYDFWFADANNLLVADDTSANAGVEHWRFSAGTWSKVATLLAPGENNAFRSVTAAKSATDNSWLVFASSNAGIRSFRYDPATNSTTVLGNLAAPANTVFRGVEVFTDPAALSLALAPGMDSGTSSTDRITNVNQLTFNASVTRAGTISLDWTGDNIPDLVQSVTETPSGPVQLTLPSALADGTYTFKATFTSADGANISDQINVTIDTHGPVAANFIPPSISGGFILGAVQFNEAIDPTTVSTEDIAAVDGNSLVVPAAQVSPSSLQPTTYVIPLTVGMTQYGTVRIGPDIRDIAGNAMNQDGDASNGEATQDQFNAAFAAPPTVSIDLQSGSDTGASQVDDITNDTTPTFDITVNQPGTIELDWTGDGVADLTQPASAAGTLAVTTPALSNGVRTFTAKFVSSLGSTISSSLTVNIDTVAPTIDSMIPTGILNDAQRAALLQNGGPTVNFSERIDLQTLTGRNTLTPPSGSPLSISPTGISASPSVVLNYSLSSPLASGAYGLSLASGIADIAGNPAAGFSGTFNIQPLTTLYVDASVTTGLQDGSSWDNAFSSLQAALAFATAGQTIRVADGTYKPSAGSDRTATFQLKNGVGIYGGYAGFGAPDPNARNLSGTPTILSGDIGTPGTNTDNSYHVVNASGTNNTALLDGVTITGGNADGTGDANSNLGGGVLILSGTAGFQSCVITANASSFQGGGVYRDSGGNIFTGCSFTSNTATRGGAVYSNHGTFSYVDCSFTGNIATVLGGAVYVANTTTQQFTRCSFVRNQAPTAGAMYMASAATVVNISQSGFYGNVVTAFGAALYCASSSRANVTNSAFAGNAAAQTGGALVSTGSSAITAINCTFVSNTASTGKAIALFSTDTSSTVANSILWEGAGSGTGQIYDVTPATSVTYSDVQGGFTGTGNINADPRFTRLPAPGTDATWGTADDDYGDLHLQATSPAVNVGSNAAVPAGVTTDLDGNARIVAGVVDMGAIELQATPGTVSIDLQASSDSGVSSTDNITNDATPTFDVTVNQGGSVQLRWAGAANTGSVTVPAAGAGTLAITPPNSLTDDTLQFDAVFTPAGGIPVTSLPMTVKVDTVAPSALSMMPSGSVSIPAGVALLQNGGPTVTFSEQINRGSLVGRNTLTLPGGGSRVSQGNAGISTTGAVPLNFLLTSPLASGVYELTLTPGIEDVAGNLSSSQFGGTFNVQPLTTLYVDASVTTGLQDGSSWTNACSSLQAALTFATAGQTIRVADGTYKPTPGSDRTATFQLKNGVGIYGGYAGFGAGNPDQRDPAAFPTILSGNIGASGDATDNSYHVVTADSVDATAVLEGVTVSGGYANGTGTNERSGGGLLSVNSSVAVRDAIFEANTATATVFPEGGGGIYATGASTGSLTNVVIRNNTAIRGGGMFLSAGASATLDHVSFSQNLATSGTSSAFGGGLYVSNSSPHLTFCTFTSNRAAGTSAGDTFSASGAGMFITQNSAPTVDNTSFTGNEASNTSTVDGAIGSGGAVLNQSTNLVQFARCTFTRNSALSLYPQGGAIYSSGTQLRLTGCQILGNRVISTRAAPPVTFSSGGAGMTVSGTGATADVINCTFVGNATVAPASAQGGAIALYSTAILRMANTTLAANSATATVSGFQGGDGIYSHNTAGASTVANSIFSQMNSPTFQGSGGTGSLAINYSLFEFSVAGTGNVTGDPRFVRNPSFGADNTWGTQDDDYGDLRLQATSPAVNVGSNAAVPVGITTDLEGNARISETVVDMGAYERLPIPGTISIDLRSASDSGASNSDNITNITTPGFDVTVNQAGLIELDVTGDGVADVSQNVAAAGTFVVTSPALSDGARNVTGYFTPLGGVRVSSTPLSVTIDTIGPAVLSHSIDATQSISLTFDSTLDAGTVSAADLFLSGPSGVISVTTGVATGDTVQFTFPAQTNAGIYYYLVGPNIRDLAGNLMNQDGDTINGESAQDQYGASSTIAAPFNFTVSKTSVEEDAANPALQGTITLPNVTASALTVLLASSDTTELTVPASVVIPAGEASVNFPVSVVKDNIIDGPQNVRLTASALSASVVKSVRVQDVDSIRRLEANFDGTSGVNAPGAWTVNRTSTDARATFDYDYSADGIPSAPGSNGSTRGLKLEANFAAPGTLEGITLTPNGLSMPATRIRISFDMWLNTNGAFPVGGTGSTEMLGVGMAYNGTVVNFGGAGVADSTGSGIWFAASNDGNTTRDYRAYQNNAEFTANANYYATPDSVNIAQNAGNPYYFTAFPPLDAALVVPGQGANQTGLVQPGAPALRWVANELYLANGVLTWSMNGLPIAAVNVGASFDPGKLSITYFDPFVSVSSNPAQTFGIVDNLIVANETPPTVSLDLQATSDSGASNTDNITNDTTPTFDVVVNQPGLIEMDWNGDGTTDLTQAAATAGTYALAPSALSDGAYNVIARFTATGGKTIASSPINLTVDTTGPRVQSVTFTLGNAATWSGRVIFEGGSLDLSTVSIADVTITGPTGDVTVASFNGLDFTFAKQITPGNYSVTIGPDIKDLAGNLMDQNTNGTQGESTADQYNTSFVVGPRPDLQVGNLAITPASPQSSDLVTISWKDVNSGDGAATGNWNDHIVVVNTTTGETIYSASSQFTGNNIPAGGSAARSLQITLPNGTAGVGEYSITVTTDSSQQIDEYNVAGTAESNNTQTLTTTSTLAPYPDLSVAVTTPADGVSGRSLNIRFTVTNNGNATAGSSWIDHIYITPAAGGADVLLGSLNRPVALAPGQSYTRNNVYTLPTGISGAYRIKVVTGFNAAFYEMNAANNIAVSDPFNVTLAPYADLRVDSVSSQASVVAGQRLAISWSVSNQGTGATDASAWVEDVYLSQNPNGLDGSAIKLGRVQNASYLGVGESYQNSLSAPIPTSLTGSYYVYVVVDATNTQSEYTFENNNTTRSAVTVTIQPIVAPAFFDVQSVTVTPAVDAFAGQAVFVTWTVKNTGGEPITGNWGDAIAVSPTANYSDTSSTILQVINITNVAPLNPGGSYTRSAYVNLPGNIAGDFFIVVDPDHNLTASETGGVGAGDVAKNTGSTPINIDLPPMPNLEVDQVTSALTGQAGTPFSVSWRVINDGFSPTNANKWSDGVYLSPTPTLQLTGPNAATLIGVTERTGGLAPAANYAASGTYTLPTSLAGAYYVFVVTDIYHQVPANDPTGNHVGSQSTPVSIAPAPPVEPPGPTPPADLRPTAVNVPSSALSGAQASFSWTVVNNGPNATTATQWNDRIYLSDHNGISGAGVIDLGNIRHTGALTVNGSYTASTTITLPNGISGNYYFFVVTNANGAVVEESGNVANNTLGNSFSVTLRTPAQLVVSNITNPAALEGGKSVSVGWTVTNDSAGGTLPSEQNWVDSVYLSNTPAVDGSAVKVGSYNRNGGLNANGSYTGSANITIPLGMSGAKYLIVQTDSLTQVYQGTPRPVGIASKAVNITAAPFAVLSVDSITTPPSAYAGQPISIGWTVGNSAAASVTNVSSWYDSVYLSRDQYLDPQTAIPLGSVRHDGALAPGASYTAGLQAMVPSNLSGLLYVFIVTDAQSQVYQAGNTAGNTQFAATPVSVLFPDLTDLETTSVQIPAAGVTGQPASPAINWTVTNNSSLAAIGSWFDAVYLSQDDKFDSSDVLIDRVQHTGGLAGGASYSGSTAAKLPAQVVPGIYRVIVRSDSSGVVRETSKLNNQAVSDNFMSLDVQQLTVDVAATGSLAPGESVYYRINVSAGDPLKLTSTLNKAYGAEFYVSYGRPPTLSQHDLVYSKPSDLKQILNIPNATAGTYYILLHRGDDAAGSANYSLTANVPSFGISATDLTHGSQVGEVTMTVSGAKLSPSTQMQLSDGNGNSVSATRVLWKDESTLWVTFDLRSLPAGTYSVKAIDGTRTSTLENSFTVDSSAAGQLQIRAVAPGVIRAGSVGQVTFFYENNGNSDIPAPLMKLSATGARLSLGDGSLVNEVQILGINRNGPAGVLPPGFAGNVTYSFVLDSYVAGADNTFNFAAVQLGDTAATIDWAGLKDISRPEHISNAAWDGIWQNMLSSVGTTLGDFQNALDETATYLSQLNRYTNSISTLLGFKYSQADASLQAAPISSATDLSVPATGLSLNLTRSMYSTISARNRTGMLGIGWITPWDARLLTAADGRKIIDFTTAQITFLPTGGGKYSGPAGAGTLTVQGGNFIYTDRTNTQYGFNSSGAISYLRDKNGNQITASVSNGKITKLTHTGGASMTFTYNPSGFVSEATASNGESVSYIYDITGQHLESVTTNGRTFQYAYEGAGNPATANALTSITFPDGSHRTFSYDPQGRITQSAGDLASQTITYSYDTNGTVVTTDAAGNTSTQFLTDYLKPGRQTDARGNITRIEYDASGNPTREILPGGLIYRFQYNAGGQMIGMLDPNGASNLFNYSSGTNFLTGFTSPRGAQTAYGYDASGNLGLTTATDGKTQAMGYNTKGELVSYRNSRNQTTLNTYNSSGLLARRDFPDGSFNSFTYDSRGNLLTMTDSGGTTTFTYDGNELLTDVAYPGGRTLSFVYDGSGRRTRMTDESGRVVRYSYDAAGRLTRVADAADATIAAYQYDPAGRLARQDNGNGAFTTYSYDAAGNVIQIVNHNGQGGIASQFQYTYDALNRISTAVTSDGNWGYTYDSSGQLRRAIFTSSNPNINDEDIQYNYDSAGNRISVNRNGVLTPYAANQRNEYIEVGGAAYQYDADGNLTSDGIHSYSYDALGRLTGIHGGGENATFTYNALGQRVASNINGAIVDFVIDPLSGQPFTERTSGGGLITQNTFGLGLISRSSASSTLFYSFDATGSTSDLLGATGTQLQHYLYDPFGHILSTASSEETPFKFLSRPGGISDPTGLVNFGGTFVNTALGRLQSPESSIASGDTNAYRFLNNAWSSKANPARGMLVTLASQLVSGIVTRLQANAFEAAQPLFAQNQVGSGFGHVVSGSIPSFLTSASPVLPGLLMMASAMNAAPSGGSTSTGSTGSSGSTGGDKDPNAGGSSGSTSNPPPRTLPPKSELVGTSLTERELSGRFAIDPTFTGTRADADGYQSVSLDPNALTGPLGYGPDQMVGISSPQVFKIEFENVETATAPAQIVSIKTSLSDKWDWRTLELKQIVFNHHVVDIPEGRSFFSTILDLRPQGENLLVAITAGVNPATGEVTWKLSSIDPDTGEAPTNPHVGLLPPNNEAGDGQGYAIYTVRGRSDVPTGSTILSLATIVFDDRPPLSTDAWLNTLDTKAPTTQLSATVAFPGSRRINVEWSGVDDENGSGVASYDVYVSANNGVTYEPWLRNTTLTSAEYIGKPGKTYKFYSLAYDNTGNHSAVPAQAQASVGVEANTFQGASIFYNNSAADGNNASANANDDNAIATDKQPLRPGQIATFANYTSYSKGINGIVIDVKGELALLTKDDFKFAIGNSNDPTTWAAAPAPSSISIRPLAGGTVQRVTITWPDNAVAKTWLQVTVRANDNTGLTAPEVFYFGNAVGDAGNSPSNAIVNATDEILARNNATGNATVSNPYDYNHDGVVDLADELVARNNGTTFITALKLINLAGTGLVGGVTGNFSYDAPRQRLEFRSTGASISLQSVANLDLVNLTTGATITPITRSYDPASGTLAFTFDNFAAGLPRGNYRATINANGSPYTVDFFALPGDANRDRKVNTSDFNLLAGSFGQGGKTFNQGDFNYDGTVDTLDFNLFAGVYGDSLPAPAAPLSATVAFSTAGASPFGRAVIDDSDTAVLDDPEKLA